MHQLVRIFLAGALLSLLALSPGFAASGSIEGVQTRFFVLSAADHHVGLIASRRALHSPKDAVAWARRSAQVRSAQMGPDTKTILIVFRDGAQLAILARPRAPVQVRSRTRALRSAIRTSAGASAGRALVLEPFASLLGHEPTYGQVEANVLTQAGFHTDILRNRQVTVASLKTLADYSLVYMETHSGVLPDGDAIITVDETDASPYASLIDDGSLMQATVAGGGNALYLAIKSNFIKLHVGQFPDSSLLFLNGCAVTNAPKFWAALRAHNVGTLIGWDNDVASGDDEQTAAYVLHDLFLGNSVDHAVHTAVAQGLGISTQFGTAHLGYLGDGDNTLPKVLVNATPTPVPTATATVTATDSPVTPTPTPVPVGHFRVQVVKALRLQKVRDLQVKVRDGDSGSLVKNARVRFDGRGVGLSTVLIQRTGRLGLATFKKLHPTRAGILVLRVSKAGYANATKKTRVK